MAARSAEIAEAVRAHLEANWPVGDLPIPTFVVDDDWDVEDIDDLNALDGRWVVVSDEDYGQVESATRAEDLDEYVIDVSFLERYVGANDTHGKPPKEWKEERKALVQDNIFRLLNDHRADAVLDEIWPETCDVTVVMDRGFIRRNKVFASVVEVVYRELRDTTS